MTAIAGRRSPLGAPREERATDGRRGGQDEFQAAATAGEKQNGVWEDKDSENLERKTATEVPNLRRRVGGPRLAVLMSHRAWHLAGAGQGGRLAHDPFSFPGRGKSRLGSLSWAQTRPGHPDRGPESQQDNNQEVLGRGAASFPPFGPNISQAEPSTTPSLTHLQPPSGRAAGRR